MRPLVTLLLLLAASPAQAMNWEGHDDDWMKDMEPARIFRESVPDARPLPDPPKDCAAAAERARLNTYEQIPLPRHGCPPPAAVPEAER